MKFDGFHVHVQPVLLNLINIGYQMFHHPNQSMPMLEIVTIKKIEHYNDCIIMEFLDNKTTQVEFDNIHALILAGMSSNNK